MKKIIILFFIINFSIFSVEKYIPKNENEKLYLEKVRKEKIKVGIEKSKYTNYEVNGESLNSIIIDLLKNYLDLNIEIVEGRYSETLENFKNKKIDIIGYIKRDVEKKDYTEFTKKLYLENLYITSKNISLNTVEDIKNKTIYVYKDDPFVKILDQFLKKEEINAKIIKVDRALNYYENNIIFISGLYVSGKGNKIFVGKTPGTSMGVSKKYKGLVPILNNAITDKYSDKVKKQIESRKIITQKEDFIKSLTKEEKEFIIKHKVINVGIEKNSAISRIENEKYVGIIPDLLKKISNITNLKFKYETSLKKGSWNNLQKLFEEEKIDVLPVSINNLTFSNAIFSDNMFKLKVYFVSRKDVFYEKIGVEKNSVYSVIARNYFFPENIKEFNSRREIIESLLNKKISGAILNQIEGFNSSKYSVEELEEVPINFAFHKNDEILKSIFNKALKIIGKQDITQGVRENQLIERNELLLEADKTKKLYKSLVTIAVLVTILAIVLIYKIMMGKKLAKSLRIDFLTGLKNRFSFNEFCKKNNGMEGVALLIDLNNFKRANDKFGHKVGDDIIVEVAKIIDKVFKKDYNFRISGDEFYSFVSKNNFQGKLSILKKESKNSKLLKKHDISFCLGYYLKNKEETLDIAFKYAGLAMYKAKEKKGYTMIEASDELLQKEERKLKIRDLMKDSIKKEFYPVFQPKVDAKTGLIKGAEALCRWKNEEMGKIFPNEFIPIAEELRLIYLIDYQIAVTSMEKVKEWIDKGLVDKDFRISFNLSMQTFDRDDCVRKIKLFIEKTGISGKNVEIEVTESVLSNNISDALVKMKKLKSLGITVSLDDFTAGHSTASLLPVLPIDVIKYDKSLLDLYNRDGEKGKIIYRNLIKMAKDLKMEMVAEGVELKENVEFLKREGVDTFQGYYFGKPIVEDEFLEKVRNNKNS